MVAIASKSSNDDASQIGHDPFILNAHTCIRSWHIRFVPTTFAIASVDIRTCDDGSFLQANAIGRFDKDYTSLCLVSIGAHANASRLDKEYTSLCPPVSIGAHVSIDICDQQA